MAVCHASESWALQRATMMMTSLRTIVVAFCLYACGAPPDNRPQPSNPDKSSQHNPCSCAITQPSSPQPPAHAQISTGCASASMPTASNQSTGTWWLSWCTGLSLQSSNCRPVLGRPWCRTAMSCSSCLRSSSFSTRSLYMCVNLRERERSEKSQRWVSVHGWACLIAEQKLVLSTR